MCVFNKIQYSRVENTRNVRRPKDVIAYKDFSWFTVWEEARVVCVGCEANRGFLDIRLSVPKNVPPRIRVNHNPKGGTGSGMGTLLTGL